jgi:hypothetical protein
MKSEKRVQLKRIPASFRDPSGFVFSRGEALYRQINLVYQKNYDHLMKSGLYKKLLQEGLLIPHGEVDLGQRHFQQAYKVIQPEVVSFVSYPYEWCFSELQDAALATLQIQKYALEFGMVLKDASAYNIQFCGGKPKLIDTLSFEMYEDGEPWIAYQQFCQHFLAPLALISYRDVRLSQFLRLYLDGIPLDLTSSLLPFRAFLKPSIFAHIRLHAGMQRRSEKQERPRSTFSLPRKKLFALVDSLNSLVGSFSWQPKHGMWAEYYGQTNYSTQAFHDKKQVIEEFLEILHPNRVWDIGGNTGVFGRIASDKNIETVCFDEDSAAVEKNYLEMRSKNERNMLPLVLDVSNPSPSIGWANEERNSLRDRGPADNILALALVHHLVISNNVPFTEIARFFSAIGKSLIIEFVQREDSQVRRMLARSDHGFPGYNRKDFEEAFRTFFSIQVMRPIKNSKRSLYLMKKI